jgi:hypothetical protein
MNRWMPSAAVSSGSGTASGRTARPGGLYAKEKCVAEILLVVAAVATMIAKEIKNRK